MHVAFPAVVLVVQALPSQIGSQDDISQVRWQMEDILNLQLVCGHQAAEPQGSIRRGSCTEQLVYRHGNLRNRGCCGSFDLR